MAAAIVLGVPHFEPPNVVPKLGSKDQFGLGQVGQIAKDGGFIEPQGYKLIGQLRMGLGSAGPFQRVDHGDARRGAPQARILEHLASFVDVVDVGLLFRVHDFGPRIDPRRSMVSGEWSSSFPKPRSAPWATACC